MFKRLKKQIQKIYKRKPVYNVNDIYYELQTKINAEKITTKLVKLDEPYLAVDLKNNYAYMLIKAFKDGTIRVYLQGSNFITVECFTIQYQKMNGVYRNDSSVNTLLNQIFFFNSLIDKGDIYLLNYVSKCIIQTIYDKLKDKNEDVTLVTSCDEYDGYYKINVNNYTIYNNTVTEELCRCCNKEFKTINVNKITIDDHKLGWLHKLETRTLYNLDDTVLPTDITKDIEWIENHINSSKRWNNFKEQAKKNGILKIK